MMDGIQRKGFRRPDLRASLGVIRIAGTVNHISIDAINDAVAGEAPFSIINSGVHAVKL